MAGFPGFPFPVLSVRSESVTARSLRIGIAALVAFAATTGSTRWAIAQEPAAPAAPAPATPAPATPADAAKEEARTHFKAGVILLQDPERPRYEEASTEFKRAYDLVHSPTILGNIGLCAMKLERDAEAIDAYTRYLAEVNDLTPAERAQTERDLVTLKAGLARVTVESQPDGAIVRDTRFPARGESVTNSYGPLQGKVELGLRRGHHVFKARYPDGAEATWEIDVNGGESHVFERPVEKVVAPIPRAPEQGMPTRPVPRTVTISGIATGVFAIGTVVTGLLAVNTKSLYENANDGTQRQRASDLRSNGQTLNVASDVFLGATVLAAAATAYFYVTRPSVPATTGILVLPGGVLGRF
jgi:hypothetical protein